MKIVIAILAAMFGNPHHHKKPPMKPAVASWYYDAGTTASGRHYTYGFASLMFGSDWGKRIRFCYNWRCVTGRLDDHGPYIAGRSFDLNQTLAGALGFSGVQTIHWRGIA